jgi:hypothetical protein
VRVVDLDHKFHDETGYVLETLPGDKFVVDLDHDRAAPVFKRSQLSFSDEEPPTASDAKRPRRSCRDKQVVPAAGVHEGEIDATDGIQAKFNGMSAEILELFLLSLLQLTYVKPSEIPALLHVPGDNKDGLFAREPVPAGDILALLGCCKERNLKEKQASYGKDIPWTMRVKESVRLAAGFEKICTKKNRMYGPHWDLWEKQYPANLANDNTQNPNAQFVILFNINDKDRRESTYYVFLVALRDLRVDEEITVDYGEGPEVNASWPWPRKRAPGLVPS